jgi:hypothetical protein
MSRVFIVCDIGEQCASNSAAKRQTTRVLEAREGHSACPPKPWKSDEHAFIDLTEEFLNQSSSELG